MQKFTARLFYQRQMLKIALYHFHFSYVNKPRIDSLIIGTMPETSFRKHLSQIKLSWRDHTLCV